MGGSGKSRGSLGKCAPPEKCNQDTGNEEPYRLLHDNKAAAASGPSTVELTCGASPSAPSRKEPDQLALQSSGATLRNILEELRCMNPKCIFVARKVSGLGAGAKEALLKYFSKFGHVRDTFLPVCKVKLLRGARRTHRNRQGGLAFVVMEDPDCVAQILSSSDEHVLCDIQIHVERFLKGSSDADFNQGCTEKYPSHDDEAVHEGLDARGGSVPPAGDAPGSLHRPICPLPGGAVFARAASPLASTKLEDMLALSELSRSLNDLASQVERHAIRLWAHTCTHRALAGGQKRPAFAPSTSEDWRADSSLALQALHVIQDGLQAPSQSVDEDSWNSSSSLSTPSNAMSLPQALASMQQFSSVGTGAASVTAAAEVRSAKADELGSPLPFSIKNQVPDGYADVERASPEPPQESAMEKSTLSSHLKELQREDPSKVFVARRISGLGSRAQGALREHFSKYGQVVKVLVADSMVNPCRNPRKGPRIRPGNLGFVVMETAEDVSCVLRAGREHTLESEPLYTIVVAPFREATGSSRDSTSASFP